MDGSEQYGMYVRLGYRICYMVIWLYVVYLRTLYEYNPGDDGKTWEKRKRNRNRFDAASDEA